MDYIIFLVSLAALIYGADLIINQSEKIGVKFGISEFVLGSTIIALGTSLPEMAASISASLQNKGELALSNIVGSNILNITLVLGTVLMLAKNVNPHRDFFAKDSSWALFPVLIFIALAIGNINNSNMLTITRFGGIALFFLMVSYILFLLKNNKEIVELLNDCNEEREFKWIKVSPLLLLGFVFVIYGADFAVQSASNIAKSFGVSDWVIGILLVSLGTSMPELMISIVAALKNKADMAIGNIIGSNMANISVALGVAAIVKPMHVNIDEVIFDISILVIATLMLVFITANKMYSKPAGISLFVLLAIFLEHTLKKFL